MRLALLPPAIATAMIVWAFQPTARAEKAHSRDQNQEAPEAANWQSLLSSSSWSGETRAILQQLAPYLDAHTFQALTHPQRKILLRYARHRLDGTRTVARCWAPGTPDAVIRAFHAVEEASAAAPRKANQFFTRWSRTATDGPGQAVQGRPITLTWSIVPDGTPIPGDPTIGDRAGPSDLRARLAELYGGNPGPPDNQPWFPLIKGIFEDIAANTGITYRYEPIDDGTALGRSARGILGVRGDIRLGGHAIDGDRSTLAYNFFPDDGDMVIDTDDNWFGNTQNNSVRLANTIAHEHGHGIGLEHVCPIDHTKLMEPFINTRFRGLQFDDIYSLQRWYGDAFEQHGDHRDNDSLETATPLVLDPANPFRYKWLSIDGGRDIDYFSVELPPDSRMTVRIVPNEGSYLEGPQSDTGACSNGSVFEPATRQDLSLELVGPDRTAVLAASAGRPAGETEEIVEFASSQGGHHFIRVQGDSTDRAQLYRLEIELSAPSVAIALQSRALVGQSFFPPNDTIEPGETVEIELTLVNLGELEAGQVQASLDGPDGFVSFSKQQEFGDMPAGAVVSRNFVFGLAGLCGSVIPLELTVTAANGYVRRIPLAFRLGSVSTLWKMSFDNTADMGLPTGWSSETRGAGSGWSLSTNRADSPPSSVFAANVASTGTSILTSPSTILGEFGGTLSFRHYYDTESRLDDGFDGGVLEISQQDGPWHDILESGATFRQGSYDRALSSAHQNPLPNRQAWTGQSGGWTTTTVNLPASLGGEPLRFRWRLGHDTSIAEEGWYLDEITLTAPECAKTAPFVSLSLEGDTASEFSPEQRARLVISAALPPLADLPIPLVATGSAVPGIDTTSLSNVILPAGQTSVEVVISALPDSEVEGEESLVLSIDPVGGFEIDGTSSAAITISDTPYGQWAAATLGLDTANGPLEDFDRDHSTNLEEYAWETDAASAGSVPVLAPHRDGEYFRIDAPLSTLPADVFIRAQASLDLETWTSEGIEALENGFRVKAGLSTRYLRLIYELLPAAP